MFKSDIFSSERILKSSCITVAHTKDHFLRIHKKTLAHYIYLRLILHYQWLLKRNSYTKLAHFLSCSSPIFYFFSTLLTSIFTLVHIFFFLFFSLRVLLDIFHDFFCVHELIQNRLPLKSNYTFKIFIKDRPRFVQALTFFQFFTFLFFYFYYYKRSHAKHIFFATFKRNNAKAQ